jgi:hypothetical protein
VAARRLRLMVVPTIGLGVSCICCHTVEPLMSRRVVTLMAGDRSRSLLGDDWIVIHLPDRPLRALRGRTESGGDKSLMIAADDHLVGSTMVVWIGSDHRHDCEIDKPA